MAPDDPYPRPVMLALTRFGPRSVARALRRRLAPARPAAGPALKLAIQPLVPDAVAHPGPRSFASAVLNLKQASWMLWPERVLVYSLVYGVRPQRCLEIGTFKGGSAVIIAAALDDIGAGKLVCVDPNPQVPADIWASIAHRATMVAAFSPAALLEAEGVAGGKFDFALIDGDHTYDGLVRDFEGTIPVLADNALLLFHDANFHEVRVGIDDCIARRPDELIDAGLLSTLESPEAGNPANVWGGIRVVRFRRRK